MFSSLCFIILILHAVVKFQKSVKQVAGVRKKRHHAFKPLNQAKNGSDVVCFKIYGTLNAGASSAEPVSEGFVVV